MSNTTKAIELSQKLLSALRQVIRGKDETLKLLITALFADGHVLLEDYPGSGKTTLAKTLGKIIDSSGTNDHLKSFKRIQFTPDLLPGDVLGVNIFEPKTGKFKFQPGPVFAHIVLADEINRTGPKVQAAFLECMAEKQVTMDSHTYPLDDLFFVIGTQNPLDMAGTYPLPQVQLDRFLFKIPMSYVDAATEKDILREHQSILKTITDIDPVCAREDILEAREAVLEVQIKELISDAIISTVQASRDTALCRFGLSTRAALMMQQALKAKAIVEGRDYITEDDFKELAPYVFLHRLQSANSLQNEMEILNELLNPAIDKLVSQGIKNITYA